MLKVLIEFINLLILVEKVIHIFFHLVLFYDC